MLYCNFSLNFQGIERDLKQIRLQNMKESELPEQNYKAKVINILSLGFVLRSRRGGLPAGLFLLLFRRIALVCNMRLLVFSIIMSNSELKCYGFYWIAELRFFVLLSSREG